MSIIAGLAFVLGMSVVQKRIDVNIETLEHQSLTLQTTVMAWWAFSTGLLAFLVGRGIMSLFP